MNRKYTTISYVAANRRRFILNTARAAGVLALSPIMSKASNLTLMESYTVGQIMDLFIKQVPGGILSNTVDTLKSGDRSNKVTGIVTAMFATIEVIKKAIDLGANFIIAHEPTFYNHTDETLWLQGNEVYQYKANLLKEHNITIWRNHDYIHRLVPDGVSKGLIDQLQWQKYADKNTPNSPNVINLPPTSLKDLINHLKTRLDIDNVRYIGNPTQPCTNVLLMPGAAGGESQIRSIARLKPDVLICGEIHEWETAEYVRDARSLGDKIALVVVGHIASEDAGSEFMLNWVKINLPGVKASRIKPGNSLSFM